MGFTGGLIAVAIAAALLFLLEARDGVEKPFARNWMALIDVSRYLAPQFAFLSKVGAASLIGCLSGHPFALFSFVNVVCTERHRVTLRASG